MPSERFITEFSKQKNMISLKVLKKYLWFLIPGYIMTITSAFLCFWSIFFPHSFPFRTIASLREADKFLFCVCYFYEGNHSSYYWKSKSIFDLFRVPMLHKAEYEVRTSPCSGRATCFRKHIYNMIWTCLIWWPLSSKKTIMMEFLGCRSPGRKKGLLKKML